MVRSAPTCGRRLRLLLVPSFKVTSGNLEHWFLSLSLSISISISISSPGLSVCTRACVSAPRTRARARAQTQAYATTKAGDLFLEAALCLRERAFIPAFPFALAAHSVGMQSRCTSARTCRLHAILLCATKSAESCPAAASHRIGPGLYCRSRSSVLDSLAVQSRLEM